jgi:hypothetical protein
MNPARGHVTRRGGAASTIRIRPSVRERWMGAALRDDLAARCVQEIVPGDGLPIRVRSSLTTERFSGAAPPLVAKVRTFDLFRFLVPERSGGRPNRPRRTITTPTPGS